MNDVLKSFTTVKEKDLSEHYELSKRSLEEVKHLTEYEDEKANRILTAIAFLSALGGAIFVALVPKNQDGVLLLLKDWNWSVWFFFILFAVFLILLISGTVFLVHALKPRFNIPRFWQKKPNSGSDQAEPDSFLFFEQILKVKLTNWKNAFRNKSADALKESYTKCNILETYLVAEKIRTKLKFLQPGVFMLWLAVICLGIWLIFCGLLVRFPPIGGVSSKTEEQSTQTPTIDRGYPN
jgi:hypothetical protein